MVLEGKVKKGLGNASFWVKKIEEIFYKKEGIKLFYGTLNIELDEKHELKNPWIIKKEEYGGSQNVYIQECKLFDSKCYIVRPEKTVHSLKIIEIVSEDFLRKKYNLNDGDKVKIEI